MKHPGYLAIALVLGCLSIISGASDKQRKADFPFGSILLACMAGVDLYVALVFP